MIDRMSEQVVRAILETMPAEITVIDANNEVIGWNRHDSRLFKRPMGSLGLNFRQCHPEKSLAKVEAIVADMKAGSRQRARFWIDLPVEGGKHKILIEFYALRDPEGAYLGCLEFTQDVEEIRGLTGEQRLLG